MSEEILRYLSALREIVTVLGIMLAGAWGIWKWLHADILRKQREVPAIAGKLGAFITPHSDQTVIVTVQAVWTNRSPYPIQFDKDETRVEVIRIPEEHATGPVLLKRGAVEPVARVFPFNKLISIRLGTGVEYSSSVHFVLERNQRFLLRWKLYRKPEKKTDSKFARTRELIVDTGNNTVSQPRRELHDDGGQMS